jgi:3-phenylpropionate/trans-cinnamate dioxygenase ferredoxin reductase subunit
LVLTDGRIIPAEVVVVGLGVTPALDWVAPSGITIDNGIVCTEYGESSLPDVYAIGDVARWFDPLRQEHIRVEHWTSAGEQAATVAHNIAAAPADREPLSRVPYFWSDQYDVKIQSLGYPSADDDVTTVRTGRGGDRLLAAYGRSGRLAGVVGFGVPRTLMAFQPLLAQGASYDEALGLLG